MRGVACEPLSHPPYTGAPVCPLRLPVGPPSLSCSRARGRGPVQTSPPPAERGSRGALRRRWCRLNERVPLLKPQGLITRNLEQNCLRRKTALSSMNVACCGHFLHSGHVFLDVKHGQAPVWVEQVSSNLGPAPWHGHDSASTAPTGSGWSCQPTRSGEGLLASLGFALTAATTPGLGHGGSADN